MSELQRFIDAQVYNYQAALEEIKDGRKIRFPAKNETCQAFLKMS